MRAAIVMIQEHPLFSTMLIGFDGKRVRQGGGSPPALSEYVDELGAS
jgi:hypothetical protein